MTASETTDSMRAGLEMLLAAVHADDPKREILVRVGDLMRDVKSITAALSDQVVVPKEPTEAMWGGLARDLVMWDRGMPNQYGSTLYKHLRSGGKDIPEWLLKEIPDIDHTPPKGTVAACIYKAMIAAAPPPSSTAGEG